MKGAINIGDGAFDRFVEQRSEALKRISCHSRGEFAFDDVRSEAWVMWCTMADNGRPLDLADRQDQEVLIARLYQQLVRYTELNVRNAVRLDHAPGDADEPHPLAHLLSAGEHHDPLVALLEIEEARRRDVAEPTASESLAGAYLHLLRRFDNRMSEVAAHLLISVSYCYRRCAEARCLAAFQQPLPPEALTARGASASMTGPWRSFRIARMQVQLCFDFESDASLFEGA
jgi:hypothetical protein